MKAMDEAFSKFKKLCEERFVGPDITSFQEGWKMCEEYNSNRPDRIELWFKWADGTFTKVYGEDISKLKDRVVDVLYSLRGSYKPSGSFMPVELYKGGTTVRKVGKEEEVTKDMIDTDLKVLEIADKWVDGIVQDTDVHTLVSKGYAGISGFM